MIYFLNNMLTLNAFYRRAISINILVYILLFSINLHFIHVFFSVNCVMVCLFFTKCIVLNGDVTKWRIIMPWDCRPSLAWSYWSLVYMTQGSILEIEFILISREKKLN